MTYLIRDFEEAVCCTHHAVVCQSCEALVSTCCGCLDQLRAGPLWCQNTDTARDHLCEECWLSLRTPDEVAADADDARVHRDA